ncbi:MAG: site-specific integrase [Nitrososphaerota archaeon]|nr:site-specific integrase [Nitrososphaerota archaeon]MDG7049493.1 site-specific integrase [Nitrososphaerota archaeon]MDG7051875.1 site-specific integrase [Nitrososphaerota archaeon]
MPTPSHSDLLHDDGVRRWYDNTSRGSIITASVYLRRLGNFCNERGIIPSDLLRMSPRQLQDLLLDTVSKMEKNGYAGSYIQGYIKAIRSWLLFNDIELKSRRIKIKGTTASPTLKDERVPTLGELKKIFLSCDAKQRAACVLMAHSGLRPEVLGDYTGRDGLKVSDLPEMEVKGEVTFRKIPTIVVVRSELSKAKHQYFSFLGEEGCEYLRNYMQERMRGGEALGPDSPVITPKVARKPFIRTINIGDMVRLAIRGAGFPWRPYVLRSYFDTQLLLAESKGLVARDYRTFWMGHVGDIENRYTTNRARLPDDMIEDMRQSYKRALKYLETNVKEERNIAGETRRQLLAIMGFKEEEIEKMGDLSDEKVREAVKDRFLGSSNQHRQVVVGKGDVPKLLGSGYEFVSPLGDSQAVLREP